MLKEMRETGVAGLLVFRANVIPDLQIDYGSGVVFEQNHLQAISKRVRGEVKLRGPDLFRFVLFLLRGQRCCQCRDEQHSDSEATSTPHNPKTPIPSDLLRAMLARRKGLR
jgi:hypothetical protein